MFYDLSLAWRNMRSHTIQTVIPVVIVALAIALSLTVLALSDAVRRGIVQASDPFGVLVIGPKGDAEQLVFNTLLLQGFPLGTVPYEIYESLANDERVQLAVPLAKGDSLAGAPLIGTSLEFFQLRRAANQPPAFQLAEGALFSEDFQAVLGSRAAAELGLSVGDTFRSSHGVGAGLSSDIHEPVYTVVGVLQNTDTPYDRAVFTTVNSIWQVHEAAESESDLTSALAIGENELTNRLTAILALPVGYIEQNQLQQEYYTRTDAQAAAPGGEIGGFFDLLRQGERILSTVGYLVLVIALLTIFLSMYSVTTSRRQEIAIIRSLGGGRMNVFRMVIFETLVITLIGALLGRLIGYAAAALIASAIAGQSAIPISIQFMPALEPLFWLLPILGALLAGLLPAALAYRVDVVEHLSAA
jgi:putative ABC transport system permease protein